MRCPFNAGTPARVAHFVGCAALWFAPSVARAQTNEPSGGASSEAPGAEAPASATSSEVPPTKQQCIQAHVQTQTSQRDGNLSIARDSARVCSSLSCPGMVISDCGRWLNSLEQRIPSVVFEVRVNGEAGSNVKVFVDNQPVHDWTSGEALRLDPGEHEFRFESPPFEPIAQNLLLAEGVRYRVVKAEFNSAAPSADPSPAAPVTSVPVPRNATPPPVVERPVPLAVYPLLGVAALGGVGFTVFGLVAKSKLNDLEDRCQPNCTDAEVQPMKTARVMADVSLGVGVAGLIAAGVVYVIRPERSGATAVGLAPLAGGAESYVRYSF